MFAAAARVLQRSTPAPASCVLRQAARSYAAVEGVFDVQRTYTRPRTLLRVETRYMKNQPVGTVGRCGGRFD